MVALENLSILSIGIYANAMIKVRKSLDSKFPDIGMFHYEAMGTTETFSSIKESLSARGQLQNSSRVMELRLRNVRITVPNSPI
jgi:hypothetical protein